MSNKELSSARKSLLSKGPNFVPASYDFNWYTLKQDFDNFVNRLRYHYYNATSTVLNLRIITSKRYINPLLKNGEKA